MSSINAMGVIKGSAEEVEKNERRRAGESQGRGTACRVETAEVFLVWGEKESATHKTSKKDRKVDVHGTEKGDKLAFNTSSKRILESSVYSRNVRAGGRGKRARRKENKSCERKPIVITVFVAASPGTVLSWIIKDKGSLGKPVLLERYLPRINSRKGGRGGNYEFSRTVRRVEGVKDEMSCQLPGRPLQLICIKLGGFKRKRSKKIES